MHLSGTWHFEEVWKDDEGHSHPDKFDATFESDGMVNIQKPTDGFAMVWYTGEHLEHQEVVLAGDNRIFGILAVYHGKMEPDETNMSGTANGKMGMIGKGKPVTGTWTAVRV